MVHGGSGVHVSVVSFHRRYAGDPPALPVRLSLQGDTAVASCHAQLHVHIDAAGELRMAARDLRSGVFDEEPFEHGLALC